MSVLIRTVAHKWQPWTFTQTSSHHTHTTNTPETHHTTPTPHQHHNQTTLTLNGCGVGVVSVWCGCGVGMVRAGLGESCHLWATVNSRHRCHTRLAAVCQFAQHYAAARIISSAAAACTDRVIVSQPYWKPAVRQSCELTFTAGLRTLANVNKPRLPRRAWSNKRISILLGFKRQRTVENPRQ